jgi:hypothetical protein
MSEKKTPTINLLNKPNKLEQLHAKEFSIDLKVQRQINEARVDEIAADFKPHALGLVYASKRADGHTYCLDGGHRISAARKANYEGLMDTKVFFDLTLKEEAELFLALNFSRAVQAIDRFKVRVTMEEPAAMNINNVLRAYGLHVDWANNASLGVISAINTLEKVYAGAGVRDEGEYPELVDKVIRTLHRAYGSNGDRMTYSKVMLEGLGVFIATFGSRIDYDRLVYILEGIAPRQLAIQARTLRDAKIRGTSLGRNSAEAIHRLYNNRFKNKLPDFHEVEPNNNYIPEKDPLYVDPNQYVLNLEESLQEA